jgi:hypothetical protein
MNRYEESIYTYVTHLFNTEYNVYTSDLTAGSIATIFSLNRRVNSGGVYIFWTELSDDYRQILYIGETESFRRRFHNHNFDTPSPGNKRLYIDEYFRGNPMRRLGLTLLAHCNSSPLVVEETADERKADEDFQNIVLARDACRDNRKRLERILLRVHLERFGVYPPWFSEDEKQISLKDTASVEARRLLKWITREGDICDYTEHDILSTAEQMEKVLPKPNKVF